MKAKLFWITLLVSVPICSVAQTHHDTDEVTTLKGFFTKGKVSGHIRNHFMFTANEGVLKDYYANATGGSIGYHTAEWKGFQLGVKGIFTYNTFSSDLNEVDNLVNKSAKWEKELYDITRPEEKYDLDRLEELYIRYHFHSSWISYGKIDLNQGPLLLKRDGRMKPFVYKGLWAEIKDIKNTELYGGWIHGVSPRAMTEWYSINNAIGINNNGFQPNGVVADYNGYAKSAGLAVLGGKYDFQNKWKIQAWNYYLHHLYNTNWFQIDYNDSTWRAGVQYVFQFADPYQQNLAYENRVFQPNDRTNVLSAKVGYTFPKRNFSFALAYLHSFSGGKFIFPRELTRENFYVSQPRSWIDGFGNTDAYLLSLKLTPQKKEWTGLSVQLSGQYIHAPFVDDYRHNKYGYASSMQGTLSAQYAFNNKLEGLNINLLYIARYSPDHFNLSANDRFYHTNLHHLNLILNFNF